MIELLLSHVVVVALFTGAAAALCVRAALRLRRHLAGLEDRERWLLASSMFVVGGALVASNSAAASTVAPAPYSPFEMYRDADGFLAIEDMAPCDQAAFYEDVEAWLPPPLAGVLR